MMQPKKVFLLPFVLLVITLFVASPGFSQGSKEGNFSFFGSIDSIPESRRFVVVNEQRVYITSATKMVDEKNHPLKINQLKVALSVSVEGIRKAEGIYADKITVIRPAQRKP